MGRKIKLSEFQLASILNENRESKNINLARKYCIAKGWTVERAQQVIDSVRHDIPNARIADSKFLLGVTRMFVDGEIQDAEMIMNLNKTLKYVASPAHVSEYDNNLNGMSAEQLTERFSTAAKTDLEADKRRSFATNYSENKAYTIVRVPDFNTASKYSDYTDWCVTEYEENYMNYTHGGLGLFYFCLIDGFENVPEVKGENCPLDEYGLSMIAVSVNDDGSCNTITSRWNHSNGGNDNVMTTEQLERIIGRNFYKTFLPYSEDEIKQKKMGILVYICDKAYEDYSDGYYRPFTPLFDTDDDYDDDGYGYYDNNILFDADKNDYFSYYFYDEYIMDTDKYVILNKNLDLAVDDFFDDVDYIGDNIFVTNGKKMNMLVRSQRERPRLASDEWFEKIIPTGGRYISVMRRSTPDGDNRWNLMDSASGTTVFDNWYKAITPYLKSNLPFAITLSDKGFNIELLRGGTAHQRLLGEDRFDIRVIAGHFIAATTPGSRNKYELYSFSFKKFPYIVDEMLGFYMDSYKVRCGDNFIYFQFDDKMNFVISGTENTGQSGKQELRNVSESVIDNAVNESKNHFRNIVITEGMAKDIDDILFPTRFKFISHLKKFLAGILEDPVGTDVSQFFSGNGITKDKLLKSLVDIALVKRHMDIDDHDKDGKPHTAKMLVRYTVPKKRFTEKADALFDELFPNGQKVKISVNEEGAAGGGGACSCSGADGNGFGSGEFITPLFGGITVRRNTNGKRKKKVDESVSEERDSDTSSAVYVYAKDHNGNWNILCARRISSKYMDEGGKWNPPMGHRHVGESFKDCVKRECMEESGLDLSEYESELIPVKRYDWGVEYVLPITGKTAEDVNINGKTDGENSKFTWIPVSRIKSMDWAWTCKEHAVSNFQKYILKKKL